MRVVIPPPLVGLITMLAMFLVNKAAPQFDVQFAGQALIAGAIAAIGLAIDGISVGAFWKAKTTVTPLKPEKASSLVVSGLYRYTRNPMYLGMLLILTGWAIWLGSPLNIALLVGFVAYITAFQIKPEEEALRDKFGEEYKAYCARVRPWI